MQSTETAYTVGLTTLGCKVAQYETEAIAEEFERHGFRLCRFGDRCDVYVINTCTVTAESDRKCRQVIRRAIQNNPRAQVLVCGCYAQTSPGEVGRIPGVTYVGGTAGKMKLAEAAERLLGSPPGAPVMATESLEGACFERMSIRKAPRTRAYIKIEDGCACRCSYCAIPGARGRVRSKAPEDVCAEVAALAAGGCREVVLTGIEISSYGDDLHGPRLMDLLEMLDARPDSPRIRLGSLSPECVRGDFVRRFAALRHAAPHLHLSMQSGSDRILHGMRRRYSVAEAESAFAALRAAVPRICFTTDMMVGFPGERDEDFADTVSFAERIGFLDMHVFAYSPRPGTPAADFPDPIPPPVKHARSAALIGVRDRLRGACLEEACRNGAPIRVLVERCRGKEAGGHTDNFMEVRFCPPRGVQSGQEIALRPLQVKNGCLLCTPCAGQEADPEARCSGSMIRRANPERTR